MCDVKMLLINVCISLKICFLTASLTSITPKKASWKFLYMKPRVSRRRKNCEDSL